MFMARIVQRRYDKNFGSPSSPWHGSKAGVIEDASNGVPTDTDLAADGGQGLPGLVQLDRVDPMRTRESGHANGSRLVTRRLRCCLPASLIK